MLILSADLLLWLNAVTEDTIHEEIELEKEDRLDFSNSSEADASDLTGSSCKAGTLTHLCPVRSSCFSMLSSRNRKLHLVSVQCECSLPHIQERL